MVVAPVLYMVDEKEILNIKKYVKNGGTLISTYYSGLADHNGKIYMGGYPGAFRDLFGIWVEETDALPACENNNIVPNVSWLPEKNNSCSYLFDLIHSESAEILGTYASDFYAGMACVTENSFGNGKAVYIGSKPSKEFLFHLFKHYTEENKIQDVLSTPNGVSAAIRCGDSSDYLFLLNNDSAGHEVDLSRYGACESLLTGTVSDRVFLKGKGVDCFVIDKR